MSNENNSFADGKDLQSLIASVMSLVGTLATIEAVALCLESPDTAVFMPADPSWFMTLNMEAKDFSVKLEDLKTLLSTQRSMFLDADGKATDNELVCSLTIAIKAIEVAKTRAKASIATLKTITDHYAGIEVVKEEEALLAKMQADDNQS